jgi:hypothetical protein
LILHPNFLLLHLPYLVDSELTIYFNSDYVSQFDAAAEFVGPSC